MGDDSKPTWSGGLARGRNSRPTRARSTRTEVRRGASGPLSVSDAIDEFLQAAERGWARDRYGRRFTDDAVAELHWCLAGYVSEELGAMSLDEVRRTDVERLLYELGDSGIAERRLRTVAKSVRALYDYAAERGLARHNPAERVALPADDEVQQPTRRRPQRADRKLWGQADRTLWGRADRAISLALRLATFALLLVALVLILESI
jgi:hypothetical protein